MVHEGSAPSCLRCAGVVGPVLQLSFINQPAFESLVNDITTFALSKPGKAGFTFAFGTSFEGQIGLWANRFRRHLKEMPGSGFLI